MPKSDFNAAEIAAREMLLAMTGGGTEDGFDSAVWLMSAMARTNPEDTVTVLKFGAVISKIVSAYAGISVAEAIEMTLNAIAHVREDG